MTRLATALPLAALLAGCGELSNQMTQLAGVGTNAILDELEGARVGAGQAVQHKVDAFVQKQKDKINPPQRETLFADNFERPDANGIGGEWEASGLTNTGILDGKMQITSGFGQQTTVTLHQSLSQPYTSPTISFDSTVDPLRSGGSMAVMWAADGGSWIQLPSDGGSFSPQVSSFTSYDLRFESSDYRQTWIDNFLVTGIPFAGF